jgi:hypothetical protein
MVIKRIGVLRLAVFQCALMAAFGLFMALLFLLIGSLFAHGQAAGLFGAMGIGAIIIFPIMYGVIGFIAGAIGGALYNLVAGVVGGIEIEVE